MPSPTVPIPIRAPAVASSRAAVVGTLKPKRYLGVVRSVVVLLVVVASAALASPLPAERNADAKTRILYSGDWTGRSQIFAVDPAGRAPLGQVTFGRTTGDCGPIACGFFAPTPSPDGRW